MSETTQRLEGLIGDRLAEIETETRRLRRALASFHPAPPARSGRRVTRSSKVVATATPPTPRSGRRGASSSKARKRAGRGQRREELLAAVEANPGTRPSALAKTMGVSPAQVSALIAKARAEKLIVRRGGGYALKR